MIAVGFAVGFNFDSPAYEVVAGIVLLLLFGYAFSWFFALMGMVASSPESAQSVGFLAIFPLTFASSAFVPTDSMPSWLEAFAEINPFTIVVNAVRALWLDAPAGNYVWGALAWTIGMIAVFAPLAVRAYRRASTLAGLAAAPLEVELRPGRASRPSRRRVAVAEAQVDRPAAVAQRVEVERALLAVATGRGSGASSLSTVVQLGCRSRSRRGTGCRCRA